MRGHPKKRKTEVVKKKTRITYSKKGDNLESNLILLGAEIVQVVISVKLKTFRVLAKKDGLIFLMGNGKTLDSCKRQARKFLKDNDASILDEVRL